MALTMKKLAIAISIAMVSLLSARAQTVLIPGVSVVKAVIPNVMLGIDPGCGTCTLTAQVYVSNRSSDSRGTRITITDANGNQADTLTNIDGATSQSEGGQFDVYNISPVTTSMSLVKAKPGVVATPMTFTVEAQIGADGFPLVVASIIVQDVDANGKILSSTELADPNTVSNALGTSFLFPVGQIGTGNSDVVFSLSNPGATPVTVNITAAPGVISWMLNGQTPPSVQQQIPPGMSTWTVGQLFGQTFPAFLAQIMPSGGLSTLNQNLITISSGATFGVAPSRVYSGPNYMVQNVGYYFSGLPAPVPVAQ
jgi:hypothetical protein